MNLNHYYRYSETITMILFIVFKSVLDYITTLYIKIHTLQDDNPNDD